MRSIIGINTLFDESDYEGFVSYEINEGVSILDYDAVVIYADNLCGVFASNYPEYYKGLLSLNEHRTNALETCYNTLRDQIVESLKRGRNIYILVGNNKNCYIDTGRRNVSGTGRNARITHIVEEFDAYGFLPIRVVSTEVRGSLVAPCCEGAFSKFFKGVFGGCCYEAFLDEPRDYVLAKAGDSEKAIASYMDYEDGKIVFLPPPLPPYEFESEQDYQMCMSRYLRELIALDERLHSGLDDFELPSWAMELSLPGERELRETLAKHEASLEELQAQIAKQKNDIRDIERYKLLITSTGAQLEEVVKRVLVDLGFCIERIELGRSDIVASYGETAVVVEVKGLSKSAAEKHSAQLEKWASGFLTEHGKPAKAILVVNGYRTLSLADRNEPVFPDQMLAYAMQRGHCLISTTQLLCLYVDTKSDKRRKERAVRNMLSTVGIYDEYDDPVGLLS